MPEAPSTATPLQGEELARYSRHVILPGIGLEGQQRLRNARVLVVGLGGLGSPAALYLAAGGVGTLGLADFDRVEGHNLQRQVLHDTDGIGSTKLASARKRLEALNPYLTLHEHPEGVTVDNALELFSQYDVIVDGSDNFPTRYLVNDAAVLTRRPLIYGSVFQFEGQVSVFDVAAGGPCYRCLFPTMPEPGTVPNCAEAGVFGALCGTIGSLQAMEAIKVITGAGEPKRGKLLVVDALSGRFRTLNLKRDPNCPVCSDAATITSLDAANYEFVCETDESTPAVDESAPPTNGSVMPESTDLPLEIPVADAPAFLQGDPKPLLLDVRESFERDIATIEGSVHIPMNTVPEQLDALPQDRPILVQCHHGGRSMRVTQFLRAKGYQQAVNLGGGIDQWAVQHDPGMARY